MKIWAKIKNSQQWENPNVCYRNILRVKRLKYCVSWDFKYLITYLVVPRFSRSCDSHLDLAIVHLIEIFHIGNRIHLEISENSKVKDKMSKFKFASVLKRFEQYRIWIICKQNFILCQTQSEFIIHATFETFSENFKRFGAGLQWVKVDFYLNLTRSSFLFHRFLLSVMAHIPAWKKHASMEVCTKKQHYPPCR